MSKVIPYSRFRHCYAGYTARNTALPDGRHWSIAASNLLWWLSSHGRMIGWFFDRIHYGGFSSVGDRFPLHFRTGIGVSEIVLLAISYRTGVGTSSATWSLTDSGGNVTTLETLRSPGPSLSAADFLSQHANLHQQIVQVSEDTEYTAICDGSGLRIVGGMVFEKLDPEANSDSAFGLGQAFGDIGNDAPIYTEHSRKALQLGEELWRKKASPIFSVSCVSETPDATPSEDNWTPIEITSTSYVNALYTSTSTVNDDSPGCFAQTQYRGSRIRKKVRCRIAIRGWVDGGAGTVKVVDSSGQLGTTLTFSNTSAEWKTMDFDLTDQSGGHKFDIHAKVTSGNTLSLTAIQAYQYDGRELIEEDDMPAGYLDGLRLAYATASTVTIDVGECRDEDDGGEIKVSSQLTADITASGANGLDQGSESSSTWYAVFVIGKSSDGTVAALLVDEANVGSETMPSGYDLKRRVGWVRNDGSSNFEDFKQIGAGRDREIWWPDHSNMRALSSGSSATWTNVDCSAMAPNTATALYLRCQMSAAGDGNTLQLRNDGATDRSGQIVADTEHTERTSPLKIPCSASQIIEYQVDSVSDNAWIDVVAYVDEL